MFLLTSDITHHHPTQFPDRPGLSFRSVGLGKGRRVFNGELGFGRSEDGVVKQEVRDSLTGSEPPTRDPVGLDTQEGSLTVTFPILNLGPYLPLKHSRFRMTSNPHPEKFFS